MTQETNDGQPLDQLFGEVYHELRRLAHRQRTPSDGATLDTTALVHELYLQMSRNDLKFAQTRQFYAYAARAMRHLLVDRARERACMKHGGDLRRTEYNESLEGSAWPRTTNARRRSWSCTTSPGCRWNASPNCAGSACARCTATGATQGRSWAPSSAAEAGAMAGSSARRRLG
jgi:hypothetical protein